VNVNSVNPAACILLLLTLTLSGCAARPAPKARGEVVIPNDCIIELKPSEKTLCHGPDGQRIKCENVTIVRKPGCEQFRVTKEGAKGAKP
jgi:hypothetical protein